MKPQLLAKYKTSYLNFRLIFLADILLGTFASAVTAVCLYFIARDLNIELLFALKYVGLGCCASVLSEFLLHAYRDTIRHMTLSDVARIAFSAAAKVIIIVIVFACMRFLTIESMFYLVFDFMLTVFCLVGIRVAAVLVYRMYLDSDTPAAVKERVLVFGVRTKAASLVTRLSSSASYSIVGFISPNPGDGGNKLCDKPIFYFEEKSDFLSYARKHNIGAVLFAHEYEARAEADGLVRFCYQNRIRVLVAPSVDEVQGGKVMQGKVRELKIEDLLGRDEITLNMDAIRSNFSGKVVLVTGAAGSIGSELVRQLATFGVKRIILFDNAETPLHNLRLELEELFPKLDFVPMIGDVRLEARVDYAFRTWRPQVVFHAAAYKHVPLMEENPFEAVLVNAVGTRIVADKCLQYGVEKMVMISTDKAVNPTNVMGCSKRLAEIYVQALGVAVEKGIVPGSTKFVTTRFGNVLGSNGSVIPRFRAQIEKGGPVTVTHPEINRYFMTIPEACRLVMEAATFPELNKIFVFDMGKPVKIDHLARRMIELAGFRPDVDIMIQYTGLRPGEKLYEELLASAENTTPTSHDRIRIATVRESDYSAALAENRELEVICRDCADLPGLLKRMKSLVPEYKCGREQ